MSDNSVSWSVPESRPTVASQPRSLVALLALFPIAVAMGASGCSSRGSAESEDRAGTSAAEPGEAPANRAEGAEGGADEGGEKGEKDAKGRVTLTEAAFRTAGIVVEPVRAEPGSTAGGAIEVPGQIEFDPARVAVISPRIAGRIERLLAVPGDRVGAGQVVALIYSPTFITAQSDLQQARRRATVLAGTADAEGARALVAAARRRLELLGLSGAAVDRVEAGETMPLLPVAAPFAGSILEAPAVAGSAIEAGAPLFRLADLAAVNIAADVPERVLSALRVGQGAQVRVAAYPDLRFSGRVTRVLDQLDPDTRTAKALVQVTNTGRVLKPGMFATVALSAAGPPSARLGTAGETAAALVLSIPATAIVTDGSGRYVFVEVAPRTFERREVLLAPTSGPMRAGGRVVVLSGVNPGERVVTRGAFTLKSEMAKSSFAEDEG